MDTKTGNEKNVHLITEELFREAYQYEEARRSPFKKVLAKSLKCTKNTGYNFFPFARWIQEYSWRNDLLGDVIAGVTVAVMHIPHGLAYAPLGKVDPVVGLYMAVFPVVIYMFLGTSRHISVGTFAVLCAMVGQTVTKNKSSTIAVLSLNSTNSTNATDATNYTLFATVTSVTNVTNWTEVIDTSPYENIQIGIAVCLLVGIWQAGLGLLRLGVITVILSDSLISGFTTGAAIHVLSYQLKNLFGVNVATYSGVFKLIHIYIDFFRKIGTVNPVTLGMSVACVTILLLFNELLKPLIDRRFPKNKIPIPIELIVIVIGIIVSHFGKLHENYDVSVVAHIPTGFPKPMVPPPGALKLVIVDSIVIALVALAINISLARIFATKGFYTVSSNQEFFAYGISNIFASFFSCLPSSASLSRSTIQFAVGGKTQLCNIFSIFVIVLILLFAGPLFEPVPYCVLSSIVVVTLKGLIKQLGDVCRIWRQNYWNGIVWVGTFLAVIILDLDIGLGVGMVLSIMSLLFTTFSYRVAVLGRVPKTNIFLDIEYYKSAQTVPNVLILQITGNMNFSNSNHFQQVILDHCNKFLPPVDNKQMYVVLDMSSATNIDPTAVNSLRHIYKRLMKSQCELYVTNCNITVFRTFEVCRLYNDIPKDHVLASVADAVEYITKGS